MADSRLKLTDIRIAWDDVEQGVREIRDKFGYAWRPEDVYAQCAAGIAFCYTCEDGFIIVKPQQNPFTLEGELFLWLCYSQHHDGLVEYYPDICVIAKDVYATTIIFESTREGLVRIAKQNHWKSFMTCRVPVV